MEDTIQVNDPSTWEHVDADICYDNLRFRSITTYVWRFQNYEEHH